MGHQVIVLDRNEVPRAVFGDGPLACPVLEDRHVERLEDGLETYELAVPENHEDTAAVMSEGLILIPDPEVADSFRIFRVKNLRGGFAQDGTRVLRIYAESAAISELNGSIIRPVTWVGATVQTAITNALTGTRWQPGIVEWAGSRTIVVDDYKSVREVLLQLASEFGGELRFRAVWRDGQVVARYVDLLQRRGRITGKRFEYRKDIEGLVREEDTTGLVTALVGIGASLEDGSRVTFKDVIWSKASGDPADKPAGQDWIGDPEALAVWGLPDGRHITGVFEDPDEQDPERLLEKTWADLQERKQVRYTYEVDAVLLEQVAGLEHEKVTIGDTVTVHDSSLDPPLILEARVIELERSYVNPAQSKVTLGHYRRLSTTIPALVEELRRKIAQREGQWSAIGEEIHKGPNPPEDPTDGQLWVDTSVEPNVLYRYDAASSRWVKATPTQPAEVGAEVAITKGPTPPDNPTVGQLWIDTSSTPHALKQWDGSQWIKSTPTQASEIGAETPAGAQAKASTAESNAKSYADTKAAQAEANAKNAVSSGAVPVPTSALQGAIDAALNLIKATQGYLYIDGNGLVVYDKPVEQNPTKAVKIAAAGIALANSRNAQGQWIWRTAITADGIVATEVTTGTMRFDRVRGGTAELGGAGNGNGLLIVRDANNAERVRVDNTGIVVDAANYRLRQDVDYVITPTPNLVRDHSFELCPLDAVDSVRPDVYLTGGSGSIYEGWSFTNGRIYNGNVPYGERAAFFAASLNNYAVQRVRVSSLNPHTISLECVGGTWGGAGTRGNARVILRALNSSGGLISTLFTWDIFADVYWSRHSRTTGALPANTYYLEIELRCPGGDGADPAVLIDGVQIVEGTYPVLYNPEQSTFDIANGNLPFVTDPVWGGVGLIRAADIIGEVFRPPSIRITRTGNFSVANGVATNIPWQGRIAGYNSAGMWEPGQPDTTQIFVPESGKYLIICTVRWAANGNGYRLMAIKVNGGNNIAKVQEVPIGGNPMYQQVAAMAHLNEGSYIQVVVLQNSGAALNLELEADTAPVLQMIKLAP